MTLLYHVNIYKSRDLIYERTFSILLEFNSLCVKFINKNMLCCGPKLSACGMVLGLWGVIMLVILD